MSKYEGVSIGRIGDIYGFDCDIRIHPWDDSTKGDNLKIYINSVDNVLTCSKSTTGWLKSLNLIFPNKHKVGFYIYYQNKNLETISRFERHGLWFLHR